MFVPWLGTGGERPMAIYFYFVSTYHSASEKLSSQTYAFVFSFFLLSVFLSRFVMQVCSIEYINAKSVPHTLQTSIQFSIPSSAAFFFLGDPIIHFLMSCLIWSGSKFPITIGWSHRTDTRQILFVWLCVFVAFFSYSPRFLLEKRLPSGKGNQSSP